MDPPPAQDVRPSSESSRAPPDETGGARQDATGTGRSPSRPPLANRSLDTHTRHSSPGSTGPTGKPSDDGEKERSIRTSFSNVDPDPGFAYVDGDLNQKGYNRTEADIITVPCPGSDALEPWAVDPLPDGYFGNVSGADDSSAWAAATELAGDGTVPPSVSNGRHLPTAADLWVTQGIRNCEYTA